MDVLEIDGGAGEGGGQVLRTALSLSMVTQKPFRIHSIRARRARPGLLRQHLTAVQACAEVCDAKITGANLGSTELSFEPGRAKHGDYRFAIGTAGSAGLVLHSVTLGLLRTCGESRIVIEGGTDNPAAPPSDFLVHVWVNAVRRLGVDAHLEIERRGYYPAGGGRIATSMRVESELRPFSLLERGATLERQAIARVSALPTNIGHREVHTLRGALGLSRDEIQIADERDPRGPGNVLSLIWRCEHAIEVFTAFGAPGKTAEAVAGELAASAARWDAANVPVGEHFADQLVLLFALAGGGTFRTLRPSLHTQTQLELIPRFLPVRFELEPEGTDVVRVSISSLLSA
jgi:RNA 3'-terminal phosphate cyclase (ATP)